MCNTTRVKRANSLPGNLPTARQGGFFLYAAHREPKVRQTQDEFRESRPRWFLHSSDGPILQTAREPGFSYP